MCIRDRSTVNNSLAFFSNMITSPLAGDLKLISMVWFPFRIKGWSMVYGVSDGHLSTAGGEWKQTDARSKRYCFRFGDDFLFVGTHNVEQVKKIIAKRSLFAYDTTHTN